MLSKTIFDRPEWREFLSEILHGKDESIEGLSVFRGEAVPLADYCVPSSGVKVPEGVEVLSLRELPGSKESPFCTFRLRVKDRDYEDILKNTVHQKHRNMVNRAEREGIHVAPYGHDEGHLNAYYRLYLKTMLRLRRVPLPFLAFGILADKFIDEVEIYLAKYDGEFIGGLFVFVWDGRMHIWGNASDRKFGNYGVNNALYAFAIKRACELGVSEVDFGSSLRESSHHFFKERWGGEMMPIYYVGDGKFGDGPSVLERIVTFFMRVMPVMCVSKLSRILHKIK